jgi:voltage-gated potassium channel Kch
MTAIGWRSTDDKLDATSTVHHSVVILGYHHGGRALLTHISEQHPELIEQVLVADYNPETLVALRKRGIAAVFVDLSSADSLEHVHLEHATIIISTIPDILLKGTSNQSLVKTCRTLAPNAHIVALADTVEQERMLQEAGASTVLSPHTVVGAAFSQIIVERVVAH